MEDFSKVRIGREEFKALWFTLTGVKYPRHPEITPEEQKKFDEWKYGASAENRMKQMDSLRNQTLTFKQDTIAIHPENPSKIILVRDSFCTKGNSIWMNTN